MTGMKFIDVVLPLPLSSLFTYALPAELQDTVRVGCRVVVPFGAKKIYTAIVWEVHGRRPEGYAVKQILEVLDAGPVLLPVQQDFWRWIAEYYMCALGDVYKAALPSGMKLESESRVALNEEYEGGCSLSARELAVFDALSRKPELTLTQLQKICGDFKVLRVVKGLLDKGVLAMREEVKRSYKPRTEVHVRLAEAYFDEHRLHDALDGLRRAAKQQAALLKYLDLADAMAALRLKNPRMLSEVGRKQLIEATGVTAAVCQALVEKGI